MRGKQRILVVCLIVLLMFHSSMAVFAGSGSYLYNADGQSVSAPAAYLADKVLYGEEWGIGDLATPMDLFVYKDKEVYIADTGNDRIVVLDAQFKPMRIIDKVILEGEQQDLSKPEGVFRSMDGLVYICDTGNERVIAVDGEGHVQRLMTNKELVAVNEEYVFAPSKVAVNSDNFVYVVDQSVYNGIIQYDPQNRFVGYFAPNEVEVTALVRLSNFWKNLFTEEQTDSMAKALPSAYRNLYIDDEDFLFTISDSEGNEVKQLNTLGQNILKKYDETVFGDRELAIMDGEITENKFADIHVDDRGNFCIAEKSQGKLYLYSSSCQLIGIFGGKGSAAGNFDVLAGLEKIGDSYLVPDGGTGTLTVFRPTAYMQNVLQALDYYQEGLYVESVDLWKSVLEQNRNMSIAYTSIGRAYFQEGMYKEGLEMLKLGNDSYFYSLCLKDRRQEVARGNFLLIVGGLVLLVVLFMILPKRIRKWILKE